MKLKRLIVGLQIVVFAVVIFKRDGGLPLKVFLNFLLRRDGDPPLELLYFIHE